MLFVIKLFPEITIKSRPVRRRLIRLLRRNLRRLLSVLDPGVQVRGEWDNLEVELAGDDPAGARQVLDQLGRIPGIALYLEVGKYPLTNLEDLAELCKAVYGPLLQNRTFAVRCKRAGKHEFRSIDVEKFVGGVLNADLETAGVRLEDPDVTVQLEVRNQDVFLVRGRYQGLGGFPLGSQDGVLSLVSGGFDSAVSSFSLMRRGLLTHYCFFNLGGKAHELAVKELALYLWMRYHSTHKVRFVTVPFEGVVAEILTKVEDSQMGVVLKRMMLRAASRVADQLHLQALVTGESIAQVSSQTLANLAMIDSVTDKLVLRPLITSDKQEIIDLARRIGTEEFSRHIPEYCGVISVKPTTRARPERIAREEGNFDFAVLDVAVANAWIQSITDITAEPDRDESLRVDEVAELGNDDTLIDIRHPESSETAVPVSGNGPARILQIPFYRLASYLADEDRSVRYLLYCDKGMMSRLHAAHLKDQGFTNVLVYKPD